jgi:hypothetical protein
MKRGLEVHSFTSGLAAVAFLAVLLFACLVALVPSAHAAIYWTDSDSGTIGRADLKGTNVGKNFIRGLVTPNGLDIAGRHLYWSDQIKGTIGRARLNGSGVNKAFLRFPDRFQPYDVTVGARHIYWPSPASGLRLIGRARIDGTRRQLRFLTTHQDSGTFSVAATGRHIYWTTNIEEIFFDGVDSIGRANLDGTGVKTKLISLPRGHPGEIAVHGRYIYWTSPSMPGGEAISRARLDGTGVRRRFITVGKEGDQRGIAGLAVAGNHIYWTTVSNTLPGTIGRVNLDGTGVRRNFIRTGGEPADVAVVP